MTREILVVTEKTKIYKLASVANAKSLVKIRKRYQKHEKFSGVPKNYRPIIFLSIFRIFTREIFISQMWNVCFVEGKRDEFSTVKFSVRAAQYFRVYVPHIDLLEPRGLSLRRVHSTPGCSFGGVAMTSDDPRSWTPSNCSHVSDNGRYEPSLTSGNGQRDVA